MGVVVWVEDDAMPEMDRLELADAVRASDALRHIPIVFVTASHQREQVERCFAHGATAYLPKPFSTAGLREHLARLVPA